MADTILLLYLFGTILAVLFCVFLTTAAWQSWSFPGSKSFGLLMAASGLYACVSLGITLSRSPAAAQAWFELGFVSFSLLPLLFFSFAVQYSQQLPKMNAGFWALFYLVAVITLGMSFSNSLHHLAWEEITFQRSGWFTMLSISFGPWLWFFLIWTFITTTIGASFILTAAVRSNRVYLAQNRVIFIAFLLPLIANIVYVLEFIPNFHLDLTPIGFLGTAVLLLWAARRYQLFDIVPVRRDALIQESRDGMLLLDAKQRVIDANPAAELIVGRPCDDLVGMPASQAISFWSEIQAKADGAAAGDGEVSIELGRRKTFYEVRISPIYRENGHPGLPGNQPLIHADGRERMFGQLMVLRDITERKEIETAQSQQAAELSMLYQLTVAINEVTRVEELVEQILTIVGKSLYSDLLGIGLLDARSNRFSIHNLLRHGKIYCSEGAPGQGVVGQVIRSRQPALIADVTKEPDYYEVSSSTRSELCVPILSGARLLGVLNAESVYTNDFDQTDLRLLSTVAGLLAPSLERLRLFEDMQQMAIIDPLTGIYNRRYFFEVAQQEHQKAIASRTELAFLMIDLDRFKQVNDSYGHALGDSLLAEVAGCVRHLLRKEDVFARYGGDEFVVMLPSTGRQMAESIAGRLVGQVQSIAVPGPDGPVGAGMSVGIAVLVPGIEQVSLEALLARADRALYAAKQNGRGQVMADSPA